MVRAWIQVAVADAIDEVNESEGNGETALADNKDGSCCLSTSSGPEEKQTDGIAGSARTQNGCAHKGPGSVGV